MKEGLLALELRRSPNLLQWMRHLPLSTCISRAHRLVPFVAGNHRRSLPLSLAQPRAEGKDEPDRLGPPVGEPAQAASGATRLIRFPSGGSVFPVSTSPLLWKRILSRCVFLFLVLLKQNVD